MSVLVTGAAGFIGMHVSAALLSRGDSVIGLDNLNAYYDPTLKRARLAALDRSPGFDFVEADLATEGTLARATAGKGVTAIVHLAAQPGVRYSIDHPGAYIESNVVGHFRVLEYARHLEGLTHLVYASSSSVYGEGASLPFSTDQRTDRPVSLYAATKAAGELMTRTYSHLYRIPATGLRFFTVYGPWGRPDMAVYGFTRAIFEENPIRLFNRGAMKRDFTYIDDIVAGVIRCLDLPPADDGSCPPHRVYNLGNNRSEPLERLVETLERAIGRKAITLPAPMQPGEVVETFADISAARTDLGFEPTTPIDTGIPRFVEWYRRYHTTE